MRKSILLVALAALMALGFTAGESYANGAVTGVVLDADGEAVAGAVVVIHSAERVRGERPFHERFETGENGVFGWRDVPQGRYHIQAGAREVGAVRQMIGVRDGEVTQVELQIRERGEREEREFGRIGGQVIDADGEPIENAIVTVNFRENLRRGMRQRGLRVRTDENGTFLFERVPVGQVAVIAAARGYNRGGERLEVEAEEAYRLRIQLDARERGDRGRGGDRINAELGNDYRF